MDFKLPGLHSLVNSDKNTDPKDYSRLIHVRDGIAFVFNDGCFFAVSLREYIKKQCKIKESHEIAEMDSILTFFDGKSFTKEFWSELVSKQEVKLEDDDLVVAEGHYTKTLDYDFDTEPLVSRHLEIKQEAKRDPVDQAVQSVYGKHLIGLISAFKSELKTDKIIFRTTGLEYVIHFAFIRQDYIFGFLTQDYDGASEIFDQFESFEDLVDMLESIS